MFSTCSETERGHFRSKLCKCAVILYRCTCSLAFLFCFALSSLCSKNLLKVNTAFFSWQLSVPSIVSRLVLSFKMLDTTIFRNSSAIKVASQLLLTKSQFLCNGFLVLFDFCLSPTSFHNMATLFLACKFCKGPLKIQKSIFN